VTTRRTFIGSGVAIALLSVSRAHAQDQKTRFRVAYLSTTTPSVHRQRFDAFRAALKELGYVEGKNLQLDVRWGEGNMAKLPGLVRELVGLNPAVIVTAGSSGVVACRNGTSTIPIVFASAGDPVEQGFVKSLRRPGGNITGIQFNDEINAKMYELAKPVLPNATRIATLANEKDPAQTFTSRHIPHMAKTLGFEPLLIHATTAEAIPAAFDQAQKMKAQAIVVSPISLFNANRGRLSELALEKRIPLIYAQDDPLRDGDLAVYSVVTNDSYHRAAVLVDKILKGANPADIPVERPTRFEITINLKAAKAFGITIPQEALLRAHKVIE
jgi:putative tryptophan/tyrosine transport system substrate-binding protein